MTRVAGAVRAPYTREMSEKLKMPFPVPKKAEVRESVNGAYWKQSEDRVAKKEYQYAVGKFLVANGQQTSVSRSKSKS